MNTLDGEREALVADAQQRLAELKRVRDKLWGDRDDALVLSELSTIESQIRSAEAVLANECHWQPGPAEREDR